MSALDGRIRTIAREEAEAVLGGEPATAAPARDGEVAELRATVENLSARLEALESVPATTATKRTSRKTAEPSE